MKNYFRMILPVIMVLMLICSCEKNPVKRLVNPTLNNTTGSWSGNWVIYDDELKTGGDVMFIGWGNAFSADLASRNSPSTGLKCIKMSWNGDTVSIQGGETCKYTGMSLIVARNYADYLNTARDISGGGYTKMSFHARKESLSSNTVLRVEGPAGDQYSVPGDNAWEGTLTDSWQEYSFNISGSLSSVRHFANIILKNTDNRKGTGGTVYIDEIKLTGGSAAAEESGSYSVYTDIFANDIDDPGTFTGTPGDAVTLASDSGNYSEGFESFRADYSINVFGWAGWFLGLHKERNMSAYSAGHLKFDLKSDYDIQVGIRSGNTDFDLNQAKKYVSDYITVDGTRFKSVSIPIADFKAAEASLDLSRIKDVFISAAKGAKIGAQSSKQYYVDNIRWTKD